MLVAGVLGATCRRDERSRSETAQAQLGALQQEIEVLQEISSVMGVCFALMAFRLDVMRDPMQGVGLTASGAVVHGDSLLTSRDPTGGDRDALIAEGEYAVRYRDRRINLLWRGGRRDAECDSLAPDYALVNDIGDHATGGVLLVVDGGAVWRYDGSRGPLRSSKDADGILPRLDVVLDSEHGFMRLMLR